jgi:hypothetical protein
LFQYLGTGQIRAPTGECRIPDPRRNTPATLSNQSVEPLLGRQKGGVIMHPSLIRREIDPAGRCERWNGHAIGGQTGDDGGSLQPARHRLAIGARQGMRAGLIGDLPRGQPSAHRFGKAQDMVRARARHAQFRACRAIGLPGRISALAQSCHRIAARHSSLSI